jgi:hypothetical protein
MTKYKHSLENQGILLKSVLSQEPTPTGALKALTYVLIGAVLGAFYVVAVKSCDKPVYQAPCSNCHNFISPMHRPPNLTSYKLYRDFHKSHRAEYLESQIVLAELER